MEGLFFFKSIPLPKVTLQTTVGEDRQCQLILNKPEGRNTTERHGEWLNLEI